MLYKSDINKISVRLWITGFDYSPNEITKKLGVEPTEIQIKGEYKTFGKGKRTIKRLIKENAWILKSPLSHRVNPDKHLEFILSKIRSNKDEFIAMFNENEAEISFGIYWGYCNPGITLDTKILQELAALNIEVGFDMYYLGENLRLETSKSKKKLASLLENSLSVGQYSINNYSEAKTIVESLSIIEEVCKNISGIYIPDLTDWESLDEEDINNRLVKLSSKLKLIKEAIDKSKYLKENTM